MFAVLLLNANAYDGPYHGLAGSYTACFVTLLCILQDKTTFRRKKIVGGIWKGNARELRQTVDPKSIVVSKFRGMMAISM